MNKLLLEIDQLKTRNAELAAALEAAVCFAAEAHSHWDADRDIKVGKCLLALCGNLKGYDKRMDALHAALANHNKGQP